MLPFHLNQASTVQYMAERDGDHGRPSPFTIASDASPFRPCPILFNSRLQDQRDRDHCHIQHYPLNHQASEQFFSSGTSNRLVSNALMDEADDEGDNLKLSLCDHYVKEEHTAQAPSKWMSSKMRIMKKMMKSNLDSHVPIVDARPSDMHAAQDRSQRNMQVFGGASNDNNSPCGIIRVCSDCHTTKTPLWRSGPCGPKSLCNACGIRQRKARRAMAAAAASGGLLPPHHATPMKVRKEKKLNIVDRTVPFKKRYKIATASSAAQAKLCFEDVTLSLNTSSTFDRVFPQDERDAAILLMALSCGLIRT